MKNLSTKIEAIEILNNKKFDKIKKQPFISKNDLEKIIFDYVVNIKNDNIK